MEGYEVVAFDDEKLGKVVGRVDGNLIVEHGLLTHSRHVLPEVFAHLDADEQVVRATVSKDVFTSSPKVEGEDFDPQAIYDHYGLVGSDPDAAKTAAYGDAGPTDPARTADDDGIDADLPLSRGGSLDAGGGANDHGHPSPGITGGDRYRDAG